MNSLAIETDTMDEMASGQLRLMPQSQPLPHGSFTSEVYRLHSFRILDVDGKNVGIVDWIWTDATSGEGEFLGVRLHWLRGTSRAVPTLGAEIDHATGTIRVAHTAAQIKSSRRFKIDRQLTAREKRRISLHYALQPATLRRELARLRSAA
jgi:hypothetical protein